MELIITAQAEKEIKFFSQTGQKGILRKIEKLLTEIESTPFIGTGKPEPLKYYLAGYWSRRLNLEHRIIYQITQEYIYIHSVKGHYF